MFSFGGGWPSTKGGKGSKGKSKLKVWCDVPSCTVTLHANDLKNHYKSHTNEEMLDRLNKAVVLFFLSQY